MATAHKLPSGSWRCQVYAGKDASGKKRYRSFTAPSKKEAEYQAMQFQLHYKEISRDASAMTLGEAMDAYLASKDGILSPSTLRSYGYIRRSSLPGLMDLKLNRLTPQLIQRAINEEAKPYTDAQGRTRVRTPKTIRNIHGLLSAVLAQYHPGLTLHTTLPQRERKEQRVLEPEQIAVLLAAVEGDVMELPVLMGVWLCMRASEITALTWDCVDFQHSTITVKKALVRGADNAWVVKATKTTGSTRTLNAPPYIMDKLSAARAASQDERVVPMYSPSLYDRLKTILRRNGLPDIRFHDLRHTAASVGLLLNVPMRYMMERGGWSSPQTMQHIYQHTMASKRSEIDDAIDAYYSSLLPGVRREDEDEAGE